MSADSGWLSSSRSSAFRSSSTSAAPTLATTKRSTRSPSIASSRPATGSSPRASRTTTGSFSRSRRSSSGSSPRPIRLGLLPHNEFGLRFWDALFGAARLRLRLPDRLPADRPGLRRDRRAGAVRPRAAALRPRPAQQQHGGPAVPVLLRRHVPLPGLGRDRPYAAAAHALAAGLYFTLGFMTKFVAALFLPLVLGIVGLAAPSVRRRLVATGRSGWASPLSSLALVLPWFVWAHLKFGDFFWETIFGAAVVTRFTEFLDPTHVQPWHFYWTTMWARLHDAHITWLAARRRRHARRADRPPAVGRRGARAACGSSCRSGSFRSARRSSTTTRIRSCRRWRSRWVTCAGCCWRSGRSCSRRVVRRVEVRQPVQQPGAPCRAAADCAPGDRGASPWAWRSTAVIVRSAADHHRWPRSVQKLRRVPAAACSPWSPAC